MEIVSQNIISSEDKKHMDEVKSIFEKYPEKIPSEYQQKILERQVVLGMTPYDAYLAAGKFKYAVEPDPKWPKNVYPVDVMWAQSVCPDNSKITMTFENASQYIDDGLVIFKVDFEHGKAVNIIMLKVIEKK